LEKQNNVQASYSGASELTCLSPIKAAIQHDQFLLPGCVFRRQAHAEACGHLVLAATEQQLD